jgi:arsenate reductase
MNIVIHHNPDCGTSRNVIATVEAAGYKPTVIEYLKTGWTRPQLLALFAAAGLTPRSALRVSKSPAEALGLTDPDVSDEKLLDAIKSRGSEWGREGRWRQALAHRGT